MTELIKKTISIRKDIIELVYNSKCGHIGGDLSVCDILTVLYGEIMNVSPENIDCDERDRFILSKGHSVEALYCVLAEYGFFPKEDLKTFSKFNSKYIGHPNNKINGVEINSGSLGHGLSVAVGMALGAKKDDSKRRTFVVMRAGARAEGSLWEGFMSAGHFKLDNLVAIIDRNGLQISGTTEEVMGHENLHDRIKAFRWNVLEIDGNDIVEIYTALKKAEKVKGSPTAIIANTVKGCGVSFMENRAQWHHKVPTETEYENAIFELNCYKRGLK